MQEKIHKAEMCYWNGSGRAFDWVYGTYCLGSSYMCAVMNVLMGMSANVSILAFVYACACMFLEMCPPFCLWVHAHECVGEEEKIICSFWNHMPKTTSIIAFIWKNLIFYD